LLFKKNRLFQTNFNNSKIFSKKNKKINPTVQKETQNQNIKRQIKERKEHQKYKRVQKKQTIPNKTKTRKQNNQPKKNNNKIKKQRHIKKQYFKK
jgi:hypothetical protein